MPEDDAFGAGPDHAGMPRVLLIEDDAQLGPEVADTLRRYEMQCAWAPDWLQATKRLRAERFDVVILDQWLGRIDSLSRLNELRALTDAWIVVLTANRSEVDRIFALEVGADDFLLKPVSGRELVARLRARLRRHEPKQPSAETGRQQERWRIVDMERRIYGPEGQAVPLTSTEFALLRALMETPGVPVDRETLSRKILKRGYTTEDRALDNLAHNIRQKIVAPVGRAPVIISVRNRGYAFTGLPDEDTTAPLQDGRG